MRSLDLLCVTLPLLLAPLTQATVIKTKFSNAIPFQFDVNGNQIDSTSGKIDYFDGSYLWYGLPFGNVTASTPFQGIESWSSNDLQTWSSNGLLFPLTPAIQAMCAAPLSGNYGRPHIIYNAQTKKYVLWVNEGAPGYLTFTSDFAIHGYVQSANRAIVGLQPPATQGGDFSIAVVKGTGYVVYSLIDFTTVGASIWPPFLQSMYMQQLTPDFLNATGPVSHVVSAANDYVDNEAESPDLFYRAPYWYVTASNTCGYCTGTLLVVYRSKTPMTGPWTRQIVSGDTCGAQSTGVLTLTTSSGTTYLHQADSFSTAPLTGTRTTAHGHQFQALDFMSDGSVGPLDCSTHHSDTVSLTLGTGVATTGLAVSSTDNSGSSITTPYLDVCDLPYYQLYQTFPSSKTGTLTEVGINIAGDAPTAPLTITIFRYQNDTNFFTPRYVWETLATVSVAAADISQALEVVRVPVNKAVAKGDKLGIALVSQGITPLCTGRVVDTPAAGHTLYAIGANQVSFRGPDGKTPPIVTLTGQEIKWYSIVV